MRISVEKVDWSTRNPSINQLVFHQLYERYLEALSHYTEYDAPYSSIIARIEWEGMNHVHDDYLIILHGKAIGFFILGHWPNSFCRNDTYVIEFFIAPECQRKGYGSQAVGWITQMMPVDGDISLYILPKNEPAKHFWKDTLERGLGYVERFSHEGITAVSEDGLRLRYYEKI